MICFLLGHRVYEGDQSAVGVLHSVSHFIPGIIKWISEAYGPWSDDCSAGEIGSLKIKN